jgi:EpsD family peptidyl-prolyl cis-trans isomerase
MVLMLRAGRVRRAAAVGAAALLLAACGGSRDKAASQTAAKVNKDEITVHQINFVLQQQRNLRPEQAEAASRQILERLIDQQLALQKAEDLKLDRDPRVVQALEAARREIVARAYLERVAEAAPRPTPAEISAYYASKPALFAERRIYNLQEIGVEARPEQGDMLRDKLAAAKNIGEFIDFLKGNDFRFAANQAVRAAEQLPLANLDAFARLKDGQAMLNPAANGFQVVVLAGSRSQPVTEEQAKPAIEQFILNERKRRLMEDDIKQLRAGAKVEYVGKFAPGSAAPASAPPVSSAASSGGGLSPADIRNGMGIK